VRRGAPVAEARADRVSWPRRYASDQLRRANGNQHHSRRNQDEGGRPNSQTDTDREPAADELTPRNVHSPTIRVFGTLDSGSVHAFREHLAHGAWLRDAL
jgi:hypothetical protein